MEGGAVLPAEGAQVLVTNDDGQAVITVTRHGQGRLAVLAGATPLENDAQSRAAQPAMARALFIWLLE